MEQIIAPLLAIVIMVYGLLFMIGGADLGNRFLRSIGRGIGWVLRNIAELTFDLIRAVGQAVAAVIRWSWQQLTTE